MKRIALLLAALMLTGCGQLDRLSAQITGYSTQCIGGVEYIQFASGVSVAYTPDGKVKTCK